mmetsp:Transcript_25517/g.31433  ORF Transcript_25517/g.31433 Transcript_25517/m.31433 type:complete len:149 (+) Transcript_25517:78-524(+)
MIDVLQANKMINGSRCTIVFYVDGNKVSHIDRAVNNEILKIMSDHFGDLTITQGKKHTFLGMDLLFTDDRKIEILMEDQCQEANDACGEDVSKPVTAPAQSHLFDVDENNEHFDKKKSELFHSITAKLLFIKHRAKPDIDTAVAFLCT